MATWTVQTYYKKSCEEHEHFRKDGQVITRRTGWRFGSWTVETTDNNPPEFEFTTVPGGNDAQDSVDMYNLGGDNIDSSELIETWDGCWEEIDFPDDMDEEEQERLQELIDEEGFYEIIEEQEGWMQDDTEMWVWGPIEILDEGGNRVKIVVADKDGNSVDFVED